MFGRYTGYTVGIGVIWVQVFVGLALAVRLALVVAAAREDGPVPRAGQVAGRRAGGGSMWGVLCGGARALLCSHLQLNARVLLIWDKARTTIYSFVRVVVDLLT